MFSFRPSIVRTNSVFELPQPVTSVRVQDSFDFAKLLERWRDEGVRETRFLIGAADGFGDAERAGADKLIAFGKATWPHMMARAMLAEQLFRATSILANHPYHREG